MNITQTDRDVDLLGALTLKVHIITLDQAARGWWGESRRATKTARERLRRLEDSGFVTRHRVSIHPLLPLVAAELEWSPGQDTPRFGPVAYRLQSRWTESLTPTTVYRATRKAANQFGGFGGKFKHRTQLTHDAHVAELYVRFMQDDPTVRDRWKGEELLAEAGGKVPDAILFDEDGFPSLVVEFGGRYDARRIRRFHRFCEDRGLSYQLW